MNSNKTAIITGASRGIGKAIALELASLGYNLALTCHASFEELQTVQMECEQLGVHCYSYRCNMADAREVTSFLSDILSKWDHIDVLVNNAGISYIGLLTDMSNEEWDQLIATNLSALFYTCHDVIPSMVHQKKGHIINISSIWGNVGASCEVAYSASKGGVNSFTRALAKELAPSGISVNAISCGVIDTTMNSFLAEEDRKELEEEIPAGRFGTTKEVASLVAQIATSSTYLTGQIITLDGGYL